VCGRKVAPPLFETLVVLGRETTLTRIHRAIDLIQTVIQTPIQPLTQTKP
jgi:hypothetical protein